MSKTITVASWAILSLIFLVINFSFFRTLREVWTSDSEFAYGLLIPPIVALIIWNRRRKLASMAASPWNSGLLIVLAGCILRILAGLSGSLVFSALAFPASLLGIVGFLWGRQYVRVLGAPIGLLVLMAPLPSYVIGEIAWLLQIVVSTMSSYALQIIGVPVYRDGNVLVLPNFVLEVKQACSGLRSIFALLSLALMMGLNLERRWLFRGLLILATPVLSVGANIIRVTGTGLIAWHFGELAANESLHAAWGVLVFLGTLWGLLKFLRLLQWATRPNAYSH